jgi:membrane protein DedA with SNARE-associated domain
LPRELLTVWISQYGYFGIFFSLVLGIIGLPIPDEFLLFLCGYLVFKSLLSFLPTVAVAALGSMCGIMASYALGRTSGLCFSRFRFTEQRLGQVRRFFERFGGWTFVFGYFVPGLRNLTGFTAGASRLRVRRFAPAALMGAVLSSVVCISFGYVFGPKAAWIFGILQRNLLLVLGAGAGFWLFRRVYCVRYVPSSRK